MTMRKAAVWSLLLVNAVLLAVIFYLLPKTMMRIRMPKEPAAAPVLAALSPFGLTRESGEAFSSEALKGRPWVASFLFTRCPGQCPMLSERLGKLQQTLQKDIRLISFSVDPAYDAPAVLQEYAKRFGADPERWIFLTGDLKTIARIQTELKLSNGEEDPNMHSLRFVLMDRESRARGYYDALDAAALSQLNADANRMAVS